MDVRTKIMGIMSLILINIMALFYSSSDYFLITLIVSVLVLVVKYRKKFLTKQSWTSDIWIVEVSEKFLIYLWAFYFTIQAMKSSVLFSSLLTVVSGWTSWIRFIFFPKPLIIFNLVLPSLRPVILLLGITLLFIVWCLYFNITKKSKPYMKLNNVEFPEYDFSFQSNLVDFLNKDNQIGDNIYWLDGAWGTGKTRFIRTFFEKQSYKVREIYYISCFGIKTRSQAEQVLQSEIESRSRLGIFSNIPVIGSLISWGFSASGLGLMKKDSVVIFDDLERVVYNREEGDNPVDYNDLLGFIDYLANHKNQKVIVIYNSMDISNTYKQIMKRKFVVSDNQFSLTNQSIVKIVTNEKVLSQFYENFLIAIFNLRLACGYSNSRELVVAKKHLMGESQRGYITYLDSDTNGVLWQRKIIVEGGNIEVVVDYLNKYVKDVYNLGDKVYTLSNSFKLDDRYDNRDTFPISPFYTSIVGTNLTEMPIELKKTKDYLENSSETKLIEEVNVFKEKVDDVKRKNKLFADLMRIIWDGGEEFCHIVYMGDKYRTNYQDNIVEGESPERLDYGFLSCLANFYYNINGEKFKIEDNYTIWIGKDRREEYASEIREIIKINPELSNVKLNNKRLKEY